MLIYEIPFLGQKHSFCRNLTALSQYNMNFGNVQSCQSKKKKKKKIRLGLLGILKHVGSFTRLSLSIKDTPKAFKNNDDFKNNQKSA